jgi:nicotinamidase-related amidase
MTSALSLPLVLVTCLAVIGCSPASTSDDDRLDSMNSGGDPGGTSGTSGSGGGGGGTGSTSGSGMVTEGSVGIVVIDVQETFVDGASNADMAGIIDRTKSAFQLAGERDVPFFLTFEGSKEGDHSLHAPLQPVLPGHAKDFIKTTYGATGLPSFFEALQESQLSHLVVLGAETDVCVLQTVLGLRKMGFTVMLQEDAVFTEETNTSPALRRMQQAGTLLVNATDVAGYVADPSALPKGGDAAVRITEPLQLGVVLNDFTDASVAGGADPLKTQKSARLRELLLVSEWFELPVYVADVGAGLPADFASSFQGQLRPISQIAQDSAVKQLVFAGTDGGLADSMSAGMSSRELFVMEDALLVLGTPAAQKEMLEPFFADGLVPTTYKSFYYDMTKSVDLAEWPSQQWVQKFDEYYWITQAPEDLPPIPGG